MTRGSFCCTLPRVVSQAKPSLCYFFHLWTPDDCLNFPLPPLVSKSNLILKLEYILGVCLKKQFKRNFVGVLLFYSFGQDVSHHPLYDRSEGILGRQSYTIW